MMSSGRVSTLLWEVLRQFVLRLAGLMGGRVAVRIALLRMEIRTLPEGSRRRFKLEAELARFERLRALLEDEELLECPRFRAMLAEAACRPVDPGRRAWIRWRWIYGWGCRSWRRLAERAREGAKGALAVARCTITSV